MSALVLLKRPAGVVLTRYVLVARNKYNGARRVVAWAECMSERASIMLAEEWLCFVSSVTTLPPDCYWFVGPAQDGE